MTADCCLGRDDLGATVRNMLFCWAQKQKSAGPGAVSRLKSAMEECGRMDLVEEIEDILSLGRRKYLESLKRVGLEEEVAASSPGQSTAVG